MSGLCARHRRTTSARQRIGIMGSYGEIWGIMGNYRELWGSMGNDGVLWGIMGFYGELWGSMGNYGEIFLWLPSVRFWPEARFCGPRCCT